MSVEGSVKCLVQLEEEDEVSSSDWSSSGGGTPPPPSAAASASQQQQQQQTSADLERNQKMAQRKLSNFGAWINVVKMVVGTGVLAMPNAFANAGLGLGIGLMALVTLVFIHGMLLLVRSAQEITRRTGAVCLDYAEMASAIFNSVPPMKKYATSAKITVNTFLLLSQLGTFSVYTLFIAQNLEKTLSSSSANLDWDYRIYLALSLPVTMAACSIRDITRLSWLMVLANLSEFYIIAVVFYYLFRNPLPSLQTIDVISAPVDRLPIAFGSIMFCLGGAGVILPLENKMRRPESMGGVCGVLFNGMAFVCLLYTVIGAFGYWVYGNQMRTSGSITLDLPQDEILANSARLVSSAAILLTNCLPFYIAISIIFPHFVAPRKQNKKHNFLMAEYILRFSIIITCYGFAAAIPRLDLFVALTGAVTTSMNSLIMPCLLDLLLRYPNIPLSVSLKNWTLIVFGIAGAVLGTVLSVKDLFVV